MKNKLRNLSCFKQGPAQSMTREDAVFFNRYIDRALDKPSKVISSIKPHGIVKDIKIKPKDIDPLSSANTWDLGTDLNLVNIPIQSLPVKIAKEEKEITTFSLSEKDKKFYKKLRRKHGL